jgi:threonylcarbamoyladenosine tRNA methylthiotransferase MtaB
LKHVPALKRLRLSSIDSIEIDDVLLNLVADEERLMPHFHLSVQSGDNLILKRMKRRHAREDTIRFCETVRRVRPEVAFGADLIAGFPTESDAMFEHTVSLVDEAGLSYLHVFPFSARERTPAAKMPQLPRAVIKERAGRLRAKGNAALAARLGRLIGTEQEILVEKQGLGRTPCFAQVHFESEARPAEIVRAGIFSADRQFLKARVASPGDSEGTRALA